MVTVHFLWTFWTFLAVPCRPSLSLVKLPVAGPNLARSKASLVYKAKDTKNAEDSEDTHKPKNPICSGGWWVSVLEREAFCFTETVRILDMMLFRCLHIYIYIYIICVYIYIYNMCIYI